MHKKSFKILVAFLLAIMFTGFFTNLSAEAANETNTDRFSFEQFDNKSNGTANRVTKRAMGTAINIIRIVGTGVSIIMITYIAIKYMMAAPSEKADFKKSMSIYIVGAVLTFAATNILAVIANFADSNIVS